MRQARPGEYRAIADQVPDERDMIAWLVVIGKPPDFTGSKGFRENEAKYWVEERMLELGIIPEINESFFHDWAIDYIDFLEGKR